MSVRFEPRVLVSARLEPQFYPSSRQTHGANVSNHNEHTDIQSYESSSTSSDPTSVLASAQRPRPLLPPLISMSSTREQIPPSRKRQRTEAGLSLDNPSESRPSKRLKSSRAEFYDSLSKVWLTRRALEELNRRTSQANSPQRPASTPRRVTRSTSIQIQRIARDGGPDLRDLRGVRLNCQSVHVISNQSFSIQLQPTSSLHAQWPPAAPSEAGTPNPLD